MKRYLKVLIGVGGLLIGSLSAEPPEVGAETRFVATEALGNESKPIVSPKAIGYSASYSIPPLADLQALPSSFADDLKVLVKRAAKASDSKLGPSSKGYRVKYYTGVAHTHHGLLEVGSSELKDKPNGGTHFTEHCFDSNGKLVKAIANLKDGTRYVTSIFLYTNGNPSGMISFYRKTYTHSDLGIYKDGKLSLVARMDAKGDVLFCERIFHLGDRVSHSVRYTAKRTGKPFKASDLILESLDLRGRSMLSISPSGELKGIHHWMPAEPRR